MPKAPEPEQMEFWYDFVSPYAYIAAERVTALAEVGGFRVDWKPCLIGVLLKNRYPGAQPTPDRNPALARYRERDVERLCTSYDLPLRWPSVFPRPSLLATRIALSGEPEWVAAYSKAIFRANFVEDRNIASESENAAILRDLGLDARAVISLAQSAEIKQRLVERGEEGLRRGIFGVPTFFFGGEMFWGQDRLDHALTWHKLSEQLREGPNVA